MNDAVNLGVFLEDVVEGGLIGNFELVEVRTLAADQLNAVEGDDRGVVQAVDDDHIVAVFEESERGEGTDVPGAASLWARHCSQHELETLFLAESQRASR